MNLFIFFLFGFFFEAAQLKQTLKMIFNFKCGLKLLFCLCLMYVYCIWGSLLKIYSTFIFIHFTNSKQFQSWLPVTETIYFLFSVFVFILFLFISIYFNEMKLYEWNFIKLRTPHIVNYVK